MWSVVGKGNNTASTAATQALGQANTLGNESQASYNALMPELQGFAANPPGEAPADIAAQTTEAMEGAGGTQAGATGAGALQESRTNNPGSARAAIASSSRGAGEQLSRRGLGIQTNNAQIKRGQQSEGLSGLQGAYGTSTGGSNQAFGETANNVNANTQAANEDWNWARTLLDPAMSGGSSAGAAALGG